MQIQVGIITISDRASQGLYDDLGGPALKAAAEAYGWKVLAEALVPDEKQRHPARRPRAGCAGLPAHPDHRRHRVSPCAT